MKILIIGGMGIIGSAITEASSNRGYDVYVLSRRPLSTHYRDLGVFGIQGDWKDDSFVSGILKEGFDVIVDTLIFNPVELKRDMALINNRCTQFIFISTDAVYNHPALEVNEETSIDLSGLDWDYGHLKREAELYLINNKENYSFSWTVVRPTMTYGDKRVPVGFGSRKNEWTLIERIKEGKPVIDFDDGCTHAACHTSTFGKAVTELYLNNNAYGEFYHISDDKPIRYEDVYQRIGEYYGTAPIVVKTAPDILKTLSPSKYTEMTYDKMPEFTLDNRKIKNIAPNVDYNVNIDNAIESEISYLEETHSSLPEDSGFNILTDAILLSYRKMKLSNQQQRIIEEYVSSLPPQYISTLKKYVAKQKIKRIFRPIYTRLAKR